MPQGLAAAIALAATLGLAGAVGQPAAANPGATAARPRLPPAKGIDNVLYYSYEALRLGREGRVELEFNIGSDGKANHVAVLLADDHALSQDARKLLAAIRFDVPSGWQSAGLSAIRYRLGMVYCLPPSGQTEQFPERVSTMIITAARIPGAPVRHPTNSGANGRCAQAK